MNAYESSGGSTGGYVESNPGGTGSGSPPSTDCRWNKVKPVLQELGEFTPIHLRVCETYRKGVAMLRLPLDESKLNKI